MKSTALLASLAVLAATVSTPLVASDRERDTDCDHHHVTNKGMVNGFDYGMQEVPNGASPDTPGHGWRYFTDPASRRAVVISPQGNYYFSNGQGLHWIAAELT